MESVLIHFIPSLFFSSEKSVFYHLEKKQIGNRIFLSQSFTWTNTFYIDIIYPYSLVPFPGLLFTLVCQVGMCLLFRQKSLRKKKEKRAITIVLYVDSVYTIEEREEEKNESYKS